MQIVKQFIIPIERREDRATASGGFVSHALPPSQEEFTVTVDFAAIAKALGPRAYHSKNGESVEIRGLVIVKHTRHK